MKIDGGCHCGAITYEAEVDPEKVMVWHCTDCQALSGSAYRSVVIAPPGKFKLLKGAPRSCIKAATSGAQRAQVFRPDCGSHNIYSAAPGDNPGPHNIRLGTVRQRAALRPVKQVWLRSAQPWVNDLGAVPGVPEQ